MPQSQPHTTGEQAEQPELMTLEELTRRTGISVRNIRFYTTRGLVPAPIRKGRSGYYSADHLARLELVRELQAHGFTLAAIERYVAKIPADASPETIALHRTLLAPWMPELPETMTRKEMVRRAGRPLSDEDLERVAGGVTPVAVATVVSALFSLAAMVHYERVKAGQEGDSW